MLDKKLLLQNSDYVIEKLKTRGIEKEIIIKLSNLIKEYNKSLSILENLQHKKNDFSSLIANEKNNLHKDLLIKESTLNKDEIKKIEVVVNEKNEQLKEILYRLPNLPLDIVPVGLDENDNKVVSKFENLGRGLVKNKKSHEEIAILKNIVNFEQGTKLAGSRFSVFVGDGAKLIRALENFMLDVQISKGYQEILPPVLVKSNIMFGTGQLPKFEEDLFKINNEDLWLIPTAEVPLTNLYNDQIIDLVNNPKKLTAYTLCFRSEAGSSGKDTKGLIRSRQFNKVELVKITSKNEAMKEFESTINDAENILKLLEIPYQKIILCTGDLGFSSSITYDLELWLPSEQRFREVSSISYFGDFQGRRAKIRYKDENNKICFAHTINGSGLAIDRVFACILEQYQNDDGTIDIPKVLIPYFGKSKI